MENCRSRSLVFVVFGHSRCYLTLVPLLLLYSASAAANRRVIAGRRASWRYMVGCAAIGACAFEAMAVDVDRLRNALLLLAVLMLVATDAMADEVPLFT